VWDIGGGETVSALLCPGSNSGLRRERPARNDVIRGTTSKTDVYNSKMSHPRCVYIGSRCR